jgi:hypothetical protein
MFYFAVSKRKMDTDQHRNESSQHTLPVTSTSGVTQTSVQKDHEYQVHNFVVNTAKSVSCSRM